MPIFHKDFLNYAVNTCGSVMRNMRTINSGLIVDNICTGGFGEITEQIIREKDSLIILFSHIINVHVNICELLFMTFSNMLACGT